MILGSLRLKGVVAPSDHRDTLEMIGAFELSDPSAQIVEDDIVEPGILEEGIPLYIKPVVTATLDTASAGTIWPIETREQVVAPFAIYVNGVLMPLGQRLFGAWAEERVDGPPAFGFTVLRRSDLAGLLDLGDTLERFGPPASGVDITIDGVYLTPGGPVAIRLVTGGRIITANNRPNDSSGDLVALEGIGRSCQYDQQNVDVVYPTGHGLTRAEQANRIFEEIGNDHRAISLARDQNGYKEVQLIGAVAYDAARQILRAGGYALREDRDGLARAFDMLPLESPDLSWTFDGNNIITGSANESSNANGPPRVKVTTTKQNVVGDSGGYSTIQRERIIEALYSPRKPDKKIDTDGVGDLSLIDSGLTQPNPALLEIYRETELETLFLGVVIARDIKIKTYYAAERTIGESSPLGRVRMPIDTITTAALISGGPGSYSQNNSSSVVAAGGDFTFTISSSEGDNLAEGSGNSVAITYVNAIDGGTETELVEFNSLGVSWILGAFVDTASGRGVWSSGERYQQTRREFTTRFFDEEGYISSEVESIEAFYVPRRALGKQFLHGHKRYIWGVDLLLNMEGVTHYTETLHEIERKETAYVVNADGFIVSRTAKNYGWGKQAADSEDDDVYFYGGTGQDVSLAFSESYGLQTTETTTYVASLNNTLTTTTTWQDARGRIIRRETTVESGYLPAAEKLPDVPDIAEYPNRKVADREDQQEVIATVSSEDLLTWRPEDWTYEHSDALLEDEVEAETAAHLELAEQNAGEVSWALPFNLALIPGQWCRIDLRPLDFDRTVRADVLRHEEIDEGRRKTMLTTAIAPLFVEV